MTIRPALGADWAEVRELRLEALALHPEAFASAHEEELGFDEETWRRRTGSERFVLQLAEQHGRLLGMAGLTRDDKLKTRHVGRLVSVYVRPAVRGHGVARAVISACVEWARQRELTVLYLGVGSENEAALRCYERCGFQRYGLEPRSLRVEDRYVDEVLMALLL